MIRGLLPWVAGLCLVSLLTYATSWWFVPKESNAAGWHDALIAGSAVVFIGSLAVLVFGTMIVGLRGSK